MLHSIYPPEDDAPRSLARLDVIERRKAMLDQPHMTDLRDYAASLRTSTDIEVPDFDPLDGGIHAKILFLFEKPGPKTSIRGKGSGFISRNNNDFSAATTFQFMKQANIPRISTITWNTVPWWNATIDLTSDELRDGAEALKNLIPLLPELRAVVMVGRRAQRIKPWLESSGFALFCSAHPSLRVKSSRFNDWKAIPEKWAEAGKFA